MTQISFVATLYNLFLGDQDSTTGWYRKGYTESMLAVFIYPRGTAFTAGGHGYYTQYNTSGLTQYAVLEGDVIKDEFDVCYEVKGVQPHKVGNRFFFNELELEVLPYFSLPTSEERFFGFEDTEHGTIGYGFEDGFERGYWTEITY